MGLLSISEHAHTHHNLLSPYHFLKKMHTFSCSKVKNRGKAVTQNQMSSLTPPYKPFGVFQVSICLTPIPLAFVCLCVCV